MLAAPCKIRLLNTGVCEAALGDGAEAGAETGAMEADGDGCETAGEGDGGWAGVTGCNGCDGGVGGFSGRSGIVG